MFSGIELAKSKLSLEDNMTKKEKILQNVAKKSNSNSGNGAEGKSSSSDNSVLLDQYRVIREDIIKLADDVARGYDMAREMLDKKTLMKDLLKLK